MGWTKTAPRRAALFAGCAFVAFAGPAIAQETTDTDNAGRQVPGGTIIVTAERRATDLQDTPLSIVAVTQDTIDAKGIENLQDLATYTPNLNITGGRGSGGSNPQFSIRGVSGGGGVTGERGVGLYLDGIYIPRTNGSVLRVLDIERVEVLRGPQGTLFGRNSTGGAIRYFTKRPDPGVTEGYLRATVANMERHDVVGALNVPLGEDAAVRVQGAYLNQGGWVQRGPQDLGRSTDYIGRADLRMEPTSDFTVDFGFIYSRSKSNGTPHVFEEFDMRPGIGAGFWEGNYADWLGDALIADGQERIAAYNDPRIVIDDFTAPGFCLIDDFDPDFDDACLQYDNTDYWQGSLNLSYDLSPDVTISSITGLSALDNESNLDWQYLGTETRQNDIESEVFYQELQLNAALLDDAIDLVVGASYFHEKGTNDEYVVNRRGTSDVPRGPPNIANTLQPNGNADAGLFTRTDTFTTQKSDSYGIFASGTWHITDRLNFTGGLRYAHDHKDYESTEFAHETFTPAPGTDRTTVRSDKSWEQLDWRASLDFSFTPDWMWYATVSKAYKAGSYGGVEIADIQTGEAQSAVLIPVDPEKVRNFETGMRIEAFDGRLRFNPTAFYMQWTNRQAARQVQCSGTAGCPEPPGFTIQILNTGNVDIYGFELDTQLFLTDDFWLDGSAGYTGYDLKDPVANSGPNLFPGPPEYTFNIGANYVADLGPGELTFNANYAYTSDQPTHPTDEGDSAYQLPAISLVNARIKFVPDNAPVSISLFANNLLDNTYASYATRFGGGYWDRGGPTSIQIPEAAPERSALFVVRAKPREVGLTLQYDF